MRSTTAFAVICIAVASAQTPQEFLGKYCLACHNQKARTAGLAVESPTTEEWERVLAKLHAGSMPPPGVARPAPAVYQAVAKSRQSHARPRSGGPLKHPKMNWGAKGSNSFVN